MRTFAPLKTHLRQHSSLFEENNCCLVRLDALFYRREKLVGLILAIPGLTYAVSKGDTRSSRHRLREVVGVHK